MARRFQGAEVARATGRLADARQLYERLPDGWENYPALAHLGLAYVLPEHAPQGIREAARASSAQDSVFGLALCHRASHDLGVAEPDEVDDEVIELSREVFADTEPDPNRSIAFL